MSAAVYGSKCTKAKRRAGAVIAALVACLCSGAILADAAEGDGFTQIAPVGMEALRVALNENLETELGVIGRVIATQIAVVNSDQRRVESALYKEHADASNHYTRECRYYRAEGPFCHVPLSLKVLLGAPLIAGGIWISCWGLGYGRNAVLGIAALLGGGLIAATAFIVLVS